MQSKLQTLSGLRFTPIEIPLLRRDRTGYTNLFSCQLRGCSVCRTCQLPDTSIPRREGVSPLSATSKSRAPVQHCPADNYIPLDIGRPRISRPFHLRPL